MGITRRAFLPAALAAASAALGYGLQSRGENKQGKEKKMTTGQRLQASKDKLYASMKSAHAAHKDTTTYMDADGQEIEAIPQPYIKAWVIDPKDPKANKSGIAAVAPDGEILRVGDVEETFIMTSAIKPFVALHILATNDEAAIRRYINIEAAGQPFNTNKLDDKGRAANHMINLGAISGCSWIHGRGSGEKIDNFSTFFNKFSAREENFKMDRQEAFAAIPGAANEKLADILQEAGHFVDEAGTLERGTRQEALEVYYALNFIEVNTIDLAVMAATINNGGINPVTGVDVFEGMGLSDDRKIDLIADLQAMMVTAGMYDAAGKWTQEVGMPAKSCVGGGVFASPMTAAAHEAFGLGFYGARLDAEGNSLQAVLSARDIAKDMNWMPQHLHLQNARAAQLKRHAEMDANGQSTFDGPGLK